MNSGFFNSVSVSGGGSGKKEPVKPDSETKPSKAREQAAATPSEPEEPPPAASSGAKKGKGSATKAKVRI